MSASTKTIENLYNNAIADNYDRDRFKLLSDSYQVALRQIQNNSEKKQITTILDLALETGVMLTELKKIFPRAKLSGIDISEKMIAIARKKIEVCAFHDDARNIGKYIAQNSTDLILVHFLLAYIAPETIIEEVAKLLNLGGLCSIATSTYQSFPNLQMLASKFLTPKELSLAQVPQNPDALISLLNSFGLKIISTNIFKKKVNFANFNEAYNWGINSGWFTQYLVNFSPNKIDTISAMPDIFPLEDEFQATIILAKKINSI